MATEPKTGLDFWPPGAMQPDLLFNAMLYWLAVWAQPTVLAIEDDPPGSPAEGDTYLVGTGTGAWAGHDDSLAYWDGVAWLFFMPLEGYEVRNLGTGDLLVFEGSGGWAVAPGGLSDAPIDGSGYVRKDGAWSPESGGTPPDAEDVPYDNTASGLTATDVQAAIDELKDDIDAIPGGSAPNVQTVTSAGTVTPTYANDIVEVTSQAAALTLANPTGTPANGHPILFRLKDNSTARAITFGADYLGVGGALPTTTIAGKWMYFTGFYSSADSKVHVILPAAVQP